MNRIDSFRLLISSAACALLAATAPATAQVCDCLADHNGDAIVDGADLGILLGDWQSNAPRSDFNNDGIVDGADLGVMLGAWGLCDTAPNDNCANAIWITDGQYDFCTMNANTDGPMPASGACTAGLMQVSHDVWYRYEAPVTGELTVTTCYQADFDTIVAVYGTPSGVPGCPGSAGTFLLGCNDYSDECPWSESSLTVDVIEGHVYTIRVGGSDGAAGSGTLTVAMGFHGSSPQEPIWLGSGGLYVVNGSTDDNQTVSDFPTNCFGGTYPGPREWILWYAFSSGPVSVTTCAPGTNYDTVITILKHTPGVNGWWDTYVTCNDDSQNPGCLLNGFNHKSTATFQAQAGAYYYVVVSGYSGAHGQYQLTLDAVNP